MQFLISDNYTLSGQRHMQCYCNQWLIFILDHCQVRDISQLLNLCKTLMPPISGIHRIYMWVRSVSRCYRPWNSRKIRCSLVLFSMKNA